MAAHVRSVNLPDAANLFVHGMRGKSRSGIDKRPVPGRVATGVDQLVGDTISNRKHHGGPDQAVYAYAVEDASWWAAELGRDMAFGAFGENLSTAGMDVTGAVIGQRWAVGSALFEVSVSRTPCKTLQAFWDVPKLMKRFTAAGRPGAYLRIVEAGDVGAGDEIAVVHTPAHGLTIGETFRALSGDRSLAARLLEAPELPAQAHASARTWLAAADRAPR